MANERFDLLVLGGGINGLATARDAALRGLKVVLVEKSDFGQATSSATLKLVHGGLRYLQHLDLIRMRESIRERSNMLRLAPHLVSPLAFLLPTHGRFINSKTVMSLALILNDLIGFDRNRHIDDPDRRIPKGHIWLSCDEVKEFVPGVSADTMTGGVLFYDAQMYNSERLSLAFALSAADSGARLANYLQADRLLKEGNTIVGAHVTDLLAGEQFDIRADVVANMTGPWSDIILDQMENPTPSREVVRSKGIQIVVPSLTEEVGLAVPSAHRDPDAIVDVGGRRFFITPWRDHSLIGTTDTVYRGDPDDFRITDKDIRDFIDEINEAYPPANLKREDVSFAFGGLRPITEANIDSGSTVSRKYEVMDHARDLKVDGLVSVVGVKYTTCRFLAEKVVNVVFKKLGRSSPSSSSETQPLAGGDIERIADYTNEAIMKDDGLCGEKVIRHLVSNYGSQYTDILDLVDEQQELGAFVPGSDEVLKAEITHAVRNECAFHLDDIVMRRTDLGTLGHPGADALRAVAEIASAELGWGDFIRESELDRVESCFKFD